MLHILIGNSSGDPKRLLRAVESTKLAKWVVPKSAVVGEAVVFCIPTQGFIAQGLIQSPSIKHPEWKRRRSYGAAIRAVTAFATPVPLAFVRENSPDWGWPHARTLSYTSISGRIEEHFLKLIAGYQAPFIDQAAQDTTPLIEGKVTSILVTVYERDPLARHQCIQHYGPVCVVCNFSFDATYGEQAAGYIHVHHIKEMSSRGGAYQIDPIRDLRPVCPNCHAVIHLRRPPYSIATVKRMRNHK